MKFLIFFLWLSTYTGFAIYLEQVVGMVSPKLWATYGGVMACVLFFALGFFND